MLQTIIVPLDGSPLAERALPYATALAHASEARVIVLHARRAAAFPDADAPDLDAVARRLRTDRVEVDTHTCHVSRVEDAGRALLDAAVELGAGQIVMATHGRGGLGRLRYGSVADQILRHTTLPVLLIPAACERRWPDAGPRRFLVCLDGSNLAEEALRPAGELAAQFRARLLLVRVVEPPLAGLGNRAVEFFGYEVIAEQARTSRYLDAMADALRKAGHAIAARSIVGEAAASITQVAIEQDVDLIAMATHGRGGLARLVMGSVATETIRHASVPVLLVRPDAIRHAVPEAHEASLIESTAHGPSKAATK